jgi:hypothetical protein
MITEKQLYNALKIILEKIKEENILWRLEGSTNLFVQKMKVKVNDLDLATTKEGYLKFKSVLKDYFVKEEYVSEKKFKSATYDINGVETEILYYENDKLNMFEQVKIVSWLGLKIPILPLPFALKFYQLIKRENKINLIKEFIKKNDN